MRITEFAPIVLFIYNRPYHTAKTLEALANNKLAAESELYIYCDGPKNDTDKNSQNEMLENIVNNYKHNFKIINTFQHQTNIGLAENIKYGISSVLDTYNSIIVLEDDIITSPYFLTYMNQSLIKYKNISKVHHINAFTPVLNEPTQSFFLTKQMMCWGWSTWKTNWENFNDDHNLILKSFNHKDIRKFSFSYRTSSWNQLQQNFSHQIKTWAAFWMASIYLKNGYCVSPTQSLTKNIGLDGSGENCRKINSQPNVILFNSALEIPEMISHSKIQEEKLVNAIFNGKYYYPKSLPFGEKLKKKFLFYLNKFFKKFKSITKG